MAGEQFPSSRVFLPPDTDETQAGLSFRCRDRADKMFVDHRVIVWKHQNAFPGGDVVDLKSITGKGIEFKEQLKDYELQEELQND